VNKGILKQPVLYLSDFFERHRPHYYDNLMRAREKNDLLQWFKFFLVGVKETAKSSVTTFDNILKLQKLAESQIQTLGSRAPNAQKVLQYLYQRPIIDAAKVAEIAEISAASSYKLIGELVRFGILEEVKNVNRGKQYMFMQYLDVFKG
jgi:Fic family protein